MQLELEYKLGPDAVNLLAINEVGHDSGVADATAGNSIPLLADTQTANVWSAWAAEWRDLVILDAHNIQIKRLNLSDFDLQDEANYDELRAFLLDEASID